MSLEEKSTHAVAENINQAECGKKIALINLTTIPDTEDKWEWRIYLRNMYEMKEEILNTGD